MKGTYVNLHSTTVLYMYVNHDSTTVLYMYVNHDSTTVLYMYVNKDSTTCTGIAKIMYQWNRLHDIHVYVTLEHGKGSYMAMCIKNRPNSEELYASLVSPTKGGREGDGESFHTHLE